MGISIGEIIATLRLKDEMSTQAASAAASLNALSNQAKAASPSVNQLGKDLNQARNSVAEFNAAIKMYGASPQLTEGLNAAKQRVSDLEGQMKTATATTGAATTATQQHAQAVDGMAGAHGRAQFALQGTVWRLRELGMGLTHLGMLWSVGITAPIMGALGASVKFASDFEKEMMKVQTLAGAGAKEIQGIRQSVLDLGPAVGQGPVELAKALFPIESEGYRGAVAMDILKKAAQGSAMGMGESADVARMLVTVMKAYEQEGMTVAQVADIVYATIQKADIPIDSLAKSLGRVTSVAASVGVPLEQVGAAIATFTRTGVSADVAVTGLRGVLIGLEAPTSRAAKALTELYGSMDNVKKEIDEKGLARFMVELVDKVNGSSKALHDVFPNFRSFTEALATARSQGKDYLVVAEEMNKVTGSFGKGFEDTAKTWAFQWEQIKAAMERVAIHLGDVLLPKLKDLEPVVMRIIDVVMKMVDIFAGLPAPVQDGIVVVGLLAAAFGPLLLVAGQIVQIISAVVGVLGGGALVGGAAAGGAAAGGGLAAAAATAGAAITSAFIPALLAITVPFALYEIYRLITTIKGLMGDSKDWGTVGNAEKWGQQRAIQVAVSQAPPGTINNYAQAMDFLREHAAKLRAEMNPNLKGAMDGATISIKSFSNGSYDAAKAMTDGQKGLQALNKDTAAYKAWLAALSPEQKAAILAARQHGATLESLAHDFNTTSENINRLVIESKPAIKAAQDHQKALENYDAAIKPLTLDQQRLVEEGLKQGATAELIAKRWDLSTVAVRNYIKTMEGLKPAPIKFSELPGRESIGEINKETIADLKKISDAWKEADDVAAKSAYKSWDYQRYLVANWVEESKRKAKENSVSWQTEFAAIEAVARQKYGAIARDASEALAKMDEESRASLEDKQNQLALLSQNYANAELTSLKQGLAKRKLELDRHYKEALALQSAFAEQGETQMAADAAKRAEDIRRNGEQELAIEATIGRMRIMQSLGFTRKQMEHAKLLTAAEQEELIKRRQQWIDFFNTLSGLNTAIGNIGNIATQLGLSDLGTTLTAVSGGMSQFLSGIDAAMKADNIGGQIAGITQAIGGAIQAFMQLSQVGSRSMRTLGATLTGLQMGASIGAMFGPIGAGIGAVIGGVGGFLAGIFSGDPSWKKLQNTVTKQFGVHITDALAKQIDQDSKRLGGHWEAALLHLTDIAKEAGGLNAGNAGAWADKLSATFMFLARHEITAAQAAEILDKNFDELVKAGTNANGLLNAQVRQLVILERQYKSGSQAIKDYISAQASNVVTGFNAIAAGYTAPFAPALNPQEGGGNTSKLEEQQAALINQIAALKTQESLTAEQENELKKAHEALLVVTFQLGQSHGDWMKALQALSGEMPVLQAGFDRMGTLAVAAFGAALASGKPLLQVIEEMGPGLDQLNKMLSTFGPAGLTATPGLSDLLQIRQFVNDNKELVGTIDGINQMLTGLNNIGMLDQQTFSALSATAVDTFNRIVAGGLTSDQAMRMMQPTLQTLWQLQHDFGFEVDATTQELIDQAAQAGIVGEQHKSVNERIYDSIKRVGDILATVFKDKLPADLQVTENAVNDVHNAVNNIPKNVDIVIDMKRGENPADDPFPDGGTREQQLEWMRRHGMKDMVPLSRGGIVPVSASTGGLIYAARGVTIPPIPPWTPIGTDTVPAMLTPGEVVLNAAQQANLADRLGSASRVATITDEAINRMAEKLAGVMASADGNAAAVVVVSGGGKSADEISTKVIQALPRNVRFNVDGLRTALRDALGVS